MLKLILLIALLGVQNFLLGNINVVVSITPQETFVKKIAGDKANVTVMVKPGYDPHTYEPKPSQMIALSNADLYFPIHIEFENIWLDKFTEQNPTMQFIDMTKGIKLIKMASHSHSHSAKGVNPIGPYEWAGLFDLEVGTYHFDFSKVNGKYADPTMNVLMRPVATVTQAEISAFRKKAVTIKSENIVSVHNKNKLLMKKKLYKLHFDLKKEQTSFTLKVDKKGSYMLLTQHFPFEFETVETFFKDSMGNAVKAVMIDPKNATGLDPHTWTSPENVKMMAHTIYKALVDEDKINAVYYKKNYESFLREIEETDRKVKSILKETPKNSKFMVFHPSWGYFAKAYDLVQLAIEVEGKDPKPKELTQIIKKAREENIKAIFTQKEFSVKSATVIASELNIKVIKETPLAKEWSLNLIKMAQAIANNK
jgi:ABC-type Zn uptake system ZnuABC Zn-binding protein ZnuA